MILPGFTATDGSLIFLVWALRALGYTPYTWKQGRNHGRFEEFRPKLLEVFYDIHRKHDCPVELIGWSKGGRMALKLSNILGADYVSGIVTIGSPIWPNSLRSLDDIPGFLHEGKETFVDKLACLIHSKVGKGLQEIKRDISTIMLELQKPAPMPPANISYTSIIGGVDMIVPREDALLPDHLLREWVQNQIVLGCSHVGLGLSGRTIVYIAQHIQSDYEHYYDEHEMLSA